MGTVVVFGDRWAHSFRGQVGTHFSKTNEEKRRSSPSDIIHQGIKFRRHGRDRETNDNKDLKAQKHVLRTSARLECYSVRC